MDASLKNDVVDLSRASMIVSGLDLAASSKRCSGYAVLDVEEKRIYKVGCLYSNEDIIQSVREDNVKLVAIDAPLIREPSYRNVDRIARKLGYPVLPPTLGPMRLLTRRAWMLYTILVEAGIMVIETHPRSALISSRCSGIEGILSKLAIQLDVSHENLGEDEVDAVIASIVAFCYVRRSCIDWVKGEDGIIYLLSKL